MKPGSLYIYVDESGSPDVFGRGGKDLLAAGTTSNYLVIAAVRTADPSLLAAAVQASTMWADLRYGSGIGKAPVTALHATNDRDSVRAQVCASLTSVPIKATAIVFDKRLLDPARPWRSDRKRFYNEMVAYLLADSLHLYQSTSIIFSHKNHDKAADLQLLAQAVGLRWVGAWSAVKVTPKVTATQQKAAGNRGLQAVDYVAWAVYQAFEHGDLSYYNGLQPILGHVWDLSRIAHYTRKSPMKNPL